MYSVHQLWIQLNERPFPDKRNASQPRTPDSAPSYSWHRINSIFAPTNSINTRSRTYTLPRPKANWISLPSCYIHYRGGKLRSLRYQAFYKIRCQKVRRLNHKIFLQSSPHRRYFLQNDWKFDKTNKRTGIPTLVFLSRFARSATADDNSTQSNLEINHLSVLLDEF